MAAKRRRCGSLARRAKHEKDPYVQRARAEGWRSRAALKLEAVDRRHRLLRSGMTVVDLGAAPGGWSQYAARRGLRVLAVDRLEMEPLDGVRVLQCDFSTDEGLRWVEEALEVGAVDVVLSDMAPNLTGHPSVDMPAAMGLAELAADFAGQVLQENGIFLVKVFQGEGFDAFRRRLAASFSRVTVEKPGASRPGSREVYLLARGRSV